MTEELPAHPMQNAVVDLMRAHGEIHGTLTSIAANRPRDGASYEEQVAFLDSLQPLITEVQLSMALVSGSLAHHLRQPRGAIN